ncbi:flagellar hook protein [Nocardioides daejeonensis]|uniref:flagellin N-terminal helical domain-containing protein n=1 Tax=Nocardioides daejeonensis TaxID=1046556 RepID=UPI000D7496AB|nr:flagellar hook protein [Nocardioides daejeonensis]
MAIGRVTQNMMVRQSLTSIETNASRLAASQEQLSTGRRLNRPSDSPADAAAAMRTRAELAAQQQHARNAEDGMGWLNQIDGALSGMIVQVRRARDLGLQGANDGAMGQQAREALATEVEQVRAALLASANTQYIGRPVFGGITAGPSAYDSSGAWVGTAHPVNRTIGPGVEIQVNVNGPDVFGPAGGSLFDDLDALAADLRAGDTTAVRAGIDALAGRLDTLTTTQADIGVRARRVEQSLVDAGDNELTLTSRLSDLEDADLMRAAIDVKMGELAYQSALATSARVLSTSLLDYLR